MLQKRQWGFEKKWNIGMWGEGNLDQTMGGCNLRALVLVLTSFATFIGGFSMVLFVFPFPQQLFTLPCAITSITWLSSFISTAESILGETPKSWFSSETYKCRWQLCGRISPQDRSSSPLFCTWSDDNTHKVISIFEKMVGSYKVSWTSWKSSSGWFERRPSGEEKVSAACSRLLCSHPLLRQLLCRGISYLISILSCCFSIFIFISFTTALLCQIMLYLHVKSSSVLGAEVRDSCHNLLIILLSCPIILSSILYFIFS